MVDRRSWFYQVRPESWRLANSKLGAASSIPSKPLILNKKETLILFFSSSFPFIKNRRN
jgi:hypothetical protein